MAEYYGDPDYILQVSGIEPEELGIEPRDGESPEDVLREYVEKWLREAKDFIDNHRGRDFGDDPPAGIVQIAERIVINMIGYLQQRRQSGIVRVGDYNVQLVEDTIITRSIREDLAQYSGGAEEGPNIGIAVVTGRRDAEDDG